MASKKGSGLGSVGFDPLASLFDGPDLRDFNEPPSEEIDREDAPRPEGTDPVISMRATGPLHALRGEEWDDFYGDEPTPAMPEDHGDTAETLLMPRPAELMPPDEDTIMTARPDLDDLEPPMATASIAARTREPPSEHTQVDKAELARALAKAALASAPKAVTVPRQEPTPATEEQDKAALAKALAAQAMARAPKAVSVPKPIVPAPEQIQAKVNPPAPAPAEPATRKRRSKAGLAARATRPMSALEAAAAAAKAEDQRRAARGPELVRLCSKVVRREFRGAKELAVVNAIPMDDRPLLTALWKGHRATFAARGDLNNVIATTTVIRGLEHARPGALVAAIVETQTSDYLVWVDMTAERVLAAFPDARAWYAKSRT